MSTTIDHLRIGHRVKVVRDFTDAKGVAMRAGDEGVLCAIRFDPLRMAIHLDIQRGEGTLHLVFDLKAADGPRNGHMRTYFELGEPAPNTGSDDGVSAEHMTTSAATGPGPSDKSRPEWWQRALAAMEAEQTEEAERVIREAVLHIGSAASIAEMYAHRMRFFQHAGDDRRAVENFNKAVAWMDTYASWATSGGEGAALSAERDRFHAALVRELGHDPTSTRM
jgi:hypothetical protein